MILISSSIIPYLKVGPYIRTRLSRTFFFLTRLKDMTYFIGLQDTCSFYLNIFNRHIEERVSLDNLKTHGCD